MILSSCVENFNLYMPRMLPKNTSFLEKSRLRRIPAVDNTCLYLYPVNFYGCCCFCGSRIHLFVPCCNNALL